MDELRDKLAALEAVNADLGDELDKESERLVEVETRLDCMVDPEEHRQKLAEVELALAASQAEVRELREALEGFTRWMSPEGSRIEAFVDCGYEMRTARNLLLTLSRPPSSTDALVAFGVKVAQLMATEAARCESGGFAWPTNDAIVDRILAGGGR